jgi:hypothetical protein
MKKYLFITIITLFGCNTKKEYDASVVGKYYCECMANKNAPNDYWYAKKVCDGLLTEKYFFFRLIEVDIKVKEYGELSDSLLDSLRVFNRNFDTYLRENCCKTVLNCRESEKRPSNSAKDL